MFQKSFHLIILYSAVTELNLHVHKLSGNK